MKTTGKLIIFVFTLLALVANTYADDVNPMHAAIIMYDKAKVEALLDKGVGVNAIIDNFYGSTPLHKVAMGTSKEIAELLLSKGADVNAREKDGGTPLHLVAALSGDKEIAELLLAKGADVNAKDNNGFTPLLRGAYGGHKDVVELLLAKGADINAKDKWGNTPLHSAISGEKKDIVELLLAKGADINAKNSYGETSLHSAASKGNKDMILLLLAKGADINAKGNDGDTPLIAAVAKGRKDVVELLLDKGSDMNAKDTAYKLTPLGRAEYLGKKDIVELLKEYPAKKASEQARLLDNIKSNPRAALVQLTVQLKGNPTDDNSRHLVIKLASELKPAPAIPEEARKHFVEGTAIVKAAKNPAQQTLAAQSFTEALKIAPWWGDAYYNLGVAQELAEKYDEAEQAFNFYLLSNPSATEKREVQDRIYGLSAKRKLAGVK